MQRGDRVRLHKKLAQNLMARGISGLQRHHRTNWITRRGTVAHVSTYTGSVTVQWDDRRTTDHWPQRALEKIT